MRKFEVSLLVLVAIVALWPDETFGRPFRRSMRGVSWNSTSKSTTTTTTTATQVSSTQVSSSQVSTAQGVAELMARYGRVGHFGGNPGYEGCGSGSTPQAAYSICCYGNSGMATVDVGYAQGSDGMWYCCRRYN